MSTIIQIKRSSSGLAPNTSVLVEAELAYSQDASQNGANAILYIESVDSGANPVIHKIGGKYYTDIVDTATASNTANKLVKRDGAGGFAGNLYGTANTAVSIASPFVSNVIPGTGITVTGTHTTTSANLTVNLASTAVTPGSYGGASSIPTIIVDQQGRITFAGNAAAAASSFTIRGNSGTDTFNTGDTMDILGVAPGISTAVTDNTISITNTGVTGFAAGAGLSTSAASGNITVVNTGVTSLSSAGHGILLSGTTGNITATFTGVGSITGTANEVDVTASTGNITIGLPNDVTIGNNLTVTGDLLVLGTATTINTATVNIEDPLVKFGNANPTDVMDIGFYGEYNNFGLKFAGLFRDASDSGTFKLFTDLTTDPTTNLVNEANFTLGTLKTNITAGNVTNLVNAIAVNSGGTGRKTLTANAVIYGDGTNAVALASGSAGQVLQIGTDGMVKFGVIDGGTY